jgi:hypothetical protein
VTRRRRRRHHSQRCNEYLHYRRHRRYLRQTANVTFKHLIDTRIEIISESKNEMRTRRNMLAPECRQTHHRIKLFARALPVVNLENGRRDFSLAAQKAIANKKQVTCER